MSMRRVSRGLRIPTRMGLITWSRRVSRAVLIRLAAAVGGRRCVTRRRPRETALRPLRRSPYGPTLGSWPTIAGLD